MILGDEIRDICVDFEPCLKAHTLISVQHKSIKLGQMIHLNVMWWCQIINLLKLETHHSSLWNLEMADTVVVISLGL